MRNHPPFDFSLLRTQPLGEHVIALPGGVTMRVVVDEALPPGVLMVATGADGKVVRLVSEDLAKHLAPEQDGPLETTEAEARPAPSATREPIIHDLKIDARHFGAVTSGQKRAEYRKLDRDFKVGDVLALNETGAAVGPGVTYTGRTVRVRLTHIATGQPLPDGFGLLSFGHPEEFDHPKHWREIVAEHEKTLGEVIDQRDAREVLVDHLLDLVLGVDRPEWSSAYGYNDAVREAEEALERFHRITDAAHKWGDAQPDSAAACTGLLEALGRRRRRSSDKAPT